MKTTAIKTYVATCLVAVMLAASIPINAVADHGRQWEFNDRWDRGYHHYDDDREHGRHHWREHKNHGHHDKHRHHKHHSSNVVIIDRSYYSPRPVYIAPVIETPVYTKPYRSRVVCTTSYNPLPGILGGAAGGVIGSHIGKGSGRTAAIISGTLVGSMLTGGYGQPVQSCAEQVFETADVGVPAVWNGPDNSYYSVTPTRNYSDNGRYCREYQSTAMVGGQRQSTYGTACQQPDGSWEIVD